MTRIGAHPAPPRARGGAGVWRARRRRGSGRWLPDAAVRGAASRTCSRRATARCSVRASRATANGASRRRPRCRRKFRRALLVFEDKRFEEHSGVDGLAIARAMRLNLRAGRVVSGGSTLTMQLARLSRGERAAQPRQQARRSGARAAHRGVVRQGRDPRAVRRRTRRSAAMSWASRPRPGATSAATRRRCRGPRPRRSPCCPTTRRWCTSTRNRERLQARRDFLLRRLHEAGDLTALDLDLALSEPLDGRAARPARSRAAPARHAARAGSGAASHRDHARCAAAGATPRSSRSEHSGRSRASSVHNAAALIVDNPTFEVLAYVGNSAATAHRIADARPRRRHHPPAAQHRQHPQAAAVRRHARGRLADAAHAAARRADALRGLRARELRPPVPRRGARRRSAGALAQRAGGAHAQDLRRRALRRPAARRRA